MTSNELFNRYGAAVFARCNQLLGDRAWAEDATQDIFLKALTQENLPEDPRHLARWLHRVATNHCLNLLRSKRVEGGVSSWPVNTVAESPEEEVHSRVVTRALFAQLPLELRTVAELFHLRNLSQTAIAEVLAISRRTVINRLTALRELAEELEAAHSGEHSVP